MCLKKQLFLFQLCTEVLPAMNLQIYNNNYSLGIYFESSILSILE